MGVFDCVASPEGREEFYEGKRPVSRPRPSRELSRSDRDISKRRGLPIFASQTSLKNIRDIDFWRRKVLHFLFSPEGRDAIQMLRVPLKPLGYVTITDFISEIPPELFQEYEHQNAPDESIYKDDKIFWVQNGIAEPGVFKWQGIIENTQIIGLQLDRKKAVPFGVHDGRGLFNCKPGHRALVAAHEVMPYKKFLRNFLGLPPKRDSLSASVRMSAKAIAAKNAKQGDKVYLPKEKKWATVQWIGKIDDETVVDLIYEPPKPEAGKPVSPDEPCISRSMSLADFIDELESEPNTPRTPLEEAKSKSQSHPQKIAVAVTVEKHATPTPPKKTETSLASPLPVPQSSEPKHTDEEVSSGDESEDDETDSSEDDDDEDEDSDTESEWEHLQSPDEHHSDMHIDEAKDMPPIRSYPEMENLVIDPAEPAELSPRLPSPKRKGFFGFQKNTKSKKAKPKSPVPVKKEEPLKEVPVTMEPPTTPPAAPLADAPVPPPRRSKSPNIFNFKIGKSKKPKPIEHLPEKGSTPNEVKVEPPKKIKVKSESGWGGLFKSKSKSSIHKLAVEEQSSPPPTPVDDMFPPDKIPTPPPETGEEFNERRIERPEFINMPPPPPPSEPYPTDRTSAQSPISQTVPTAIIPENKSVEKVDPESQSSDEETDTSEESESEEEASVQQKVELAPPPPKTPVPESDSSSEDDEEVFEKDEEEAKPVVVEVTRKNSERTSWQSSVADNPKTPTTPQEPTTPTTAYPASASTYLERFKESKVRNRPSSFGSFLARLKNQPKKPDGSLQAPKSPIPSPEPLEDKWEENTQTQHNEREINQEIVQQDARPSSPSVSSMEVNEPEHASEEGMMITKTLVKPPKMPPPQRVSVPEGNQEGIILDLLDVQETPPPPPKASSVESETPKRKAGRGTTFSFAFTKKRKPSTPKEPEPMAITGDSEEAHVSNENQDPEVKQGEEKHAEAAVKERKNSKSGSNSFRDSFRRTFSLTRKKTVPPPVPVDYVSDGEQPLSPPANKITKPRPVTLYIDNNEALEQRDSFRSKRPQSVHVDIKPWSSRHGVEGVDIYSPSDSAPRSPGGTPTTPTNPALTPKEPAPEVPKHRIFTTPAFFTKKNKKVDNEPLIPAKSSKALKKKSSSEDESYAPQPVASSGKSTPLTSPTSDKPPPLPTAPPPLLKTKRQSSLKGKPVLVEENPNTALKSAMKQRKEIDSIPRGLKINDRVLWYSGKGPVPGTVQKLFKDGTDKYTAMVKFDREVSDEPLRLVREGDAYMITVEELITPDMFSPTTPTQTEVVVTPPTPQTPTSVPSVRFGTENQALEIQEDSDEEQSDLPPPFQEEEVSMACGFRRGIQCQDKSCCLETIIFSLFYTTNAFDISMLFPNYRDEDSVTRSARRILRKEIVDPLRRDGFCGQAAVKKLRDAVKPLSGEWQTLSTDAEVMMFILFDQALKLGKFISYSSNMSDFLHQLVVDPKDLSKSTTVQHLFETSLQLMDKIKLKTVPTPALILEMPRSNDTLMQYKAVIPNLTLHVSHIMENGPRLCICGVVAKYDCMQCSAHVGNMSIVYCDNCKGTADVIHFQLTHEPQLAPLSQPIIVLDLVGIICVKGGHYFSFVKCGNHSLSPWVFFDGAEAENPKVCIEQNLGMWLDRLEKYPGRYHDALQYPLLTHILQDSHICIYQPREKSSSV